MIKMCKNTILSIIIFLSLIMITTVYAVDFNPNAKACWDWKSDATDQWNDYDGSVTGAPVRSNSYGFTGGGEYAFDTSSQQIAVGAAGDFNFLGNVTFLTCINTSSTSGTKYAFGSYDGGSEIVGLLGSGATSKAQFFTSVAAVDSTQQITTSEILCFTQTYENTTNISNMYIDGILNATGVTGHNQGFSEQQFFGARTVGVGNWNGGIGISAYWENRTFTSTEVTDLWTLIEGGQDCAGILSGGADTTPPTVTILAPSDDSRNNSDILTFFVNVTDDTSNNVTCELTNTSFLLGTQWKNTTEIIEFDYDTPDLVNFNETYTIKCFDNTPANNSANDTVTVYIDTLPPFLTVTSPGNNTNLLRTETLNINIECQDDNILRLNWTILNASGIINSSQNNTPTAGVMNLLQNISLTSYGFGSYNLTMICSDGHTKKKIKDYDVIKDKPNKKIKYTTDKDKNIEVWSKQDIKDLNTWKEGDRYKFTFNYDENDGVYIFGLKSDEPLTYLMNSKYKAHFITSQNWIDFQLEGSADYLIQKLTDYEYQITITYNGKDLEFDSIGDLNVRESLYIFDVVAAAAAVDDDDGLPLETLALMVAMVFLFLLIYSLVRRQ